MDDTIEEEMKVTDSFNQKKLLHCKIWEFPPNLWLNMLLTQKIMLKLRENKVSIIL